MTQIGAAGIPDDFGLDSNYPNPFNPSTTIRFSIPAQGGSMPVTLSVYNTTGQRITTLVAAEMLPGTYTATWNGMDANGLAVASGVYFYRLNVGQVFEQTRQMSLLK